MNNLYGLRLSIGDGTGEELLAFNIDKLSLKSIEEAVKIASKWLEEIEAEA